MAKLVPCSRHMVGRALACGDIEAAAFLDLDGRLQPLFVPDVAIVLLALLQGSRRHHVEPQPVFTAQV